jgi:transcription initiation factor IIE alpha subunit
MNDFLCPKCKGHLRVGDHIIFKVKNNLKQSALMLLSPQIGNYSSVKHPSFEFNQGEVLEFYCPLCNASLKSDIHQNLALILMKDETRKGYAVYFSQVAGEHSTYETDGEAVRVTGENAGLYTYFKVGDKFKKYL